MAINEITQDGKVTQLEIDAPTLDHATVLATEWCEENNCLLKEVKLNDRVYIVEVCSDDYE